MKEGVLTSVRQVRLVNEPERKTLTKPVSVGWGQPAPGGPRKSKRRDRREY